MQMSSKVLVPSLIVVLAIFLCATDVLAQGPGRGGRQRGGRDGQGGTENPQRLLQSESIQQELEMTDEQIELIKELNEGRQRGGGVDREKLRAELEELSDEERAAKIKELRSARTTEQMDKLGEILLPHQMDRLSQLSIQASAQGGARSLLNGPIAEKLNITEDQKEELQEKAQELEKQFNEEVAKLRAEMQEKLLDSLSPEQKAEFKKLTGDSFTFERQQRGARGAQGNRGGGRGAADGRRGGGGDRGNGAGRQGRGGDRNEDA